jgi:hypothetical protein
VFDEGDDTTATVAGVPTRKKPPTNRKKPPRLIKDTSVLAGGAFVIPALEGCGLVAVLEPTSTKVGVAAKETRGVANEQQTNAISIRFATRALSTSILP